MRQMSRLNWRRALLGGVLAAVLWGVLYAPVHPLVEVHTTLGRPVLPITPFRGAALLLRVLVVLTGFVQGIATVCLYADRKSTLLNSSYTSTSYAVCGLY